MKRFLNWLPPFLVGLAVAVSGYLAVGMLLFEDAGMFRALTVILGVELGALALGLGSGVRPGTSPGDALRGRWLFLLFTLAAAAAFAVAWTLLGGMGGAALTQGLGLALLGGLPPYAAGLLLAGMGHHAFERDDPRSVGGPAALGASTGVLFTGTIGMARVGAPALLLLLLMGLSVTALVQGWVLSAAEEPGSDDDESEEDEEK